MPSPAFSNTCDVGNKEINPNTVWVLDADNDGFYTGDPVTQCAQPNAGYAIKTNQQAGDCNDADNTVWRTGTFYNDSDEDGYTVGDGENLCYGENTPAGYQTVRSATDDCEDRVSTVWRTGTFYTDNDGDGYTVGSGTAGCYGANIPTGYSLTQSTTEDCNDYDNTKWRSATVYTDGDGDGYTTGSGITICYGTDLPAGYKLASSAQEDCRDDLAAINPGAAEVCGNNIDDNCNGQIDENCGPCANGTALATMAITASSAQLTWKAGTNAVQWQVQYKSLATGSRWTTVTVSGTARSVTLTGLKVNQRYKWSLRAKCGNKWTSWSYEAEFKTAAVGGITTRAKESSAIPEADGPASLVVPNLLHRNQQWRIPNLPANNEVLVTDMNGKLVLKVRNYGNTHSFSSAANGLYFYQIQTTNSNGKPVMYKGKLLIAD